MKSILFRQQLVLALLGVLFLLGKQLFGQNPPTPPGNGNFSQTGIIVSGTLGGPPSDSESLYEVFGASCLEDLGGYVVMNNQVEWIIPDANNTRQANMTIVVKDGNNHIRNTNYLGNVNSQIVIRVDIHQPRRPNTPLPPPTITPAIPFNYTYTSLGELVIDFYLLYSCLLPVDYPNDLSLGSIFNQEYQDLQYAWTPGYSYFIYERICRSQVPDPSLSIRQARTDLPPTLSVSPNPFSHTIQLKQDVADEGSHIVTLFNAQGVMLRQSTLDAPGERLNWQSAHLPAGMYFVHLEDEWGNKSIQKLMKIN